MASATAHAQVHGRDLDAVRETPARGRSVGSKNAVRPNRSARLKYIQTTTDRTAAVNENHSRTPTQSIVPFRRLAAQDRLGENERSPHGREADLPYQANPWTAALGRLDRNEQ